MRRPLRPFWENVRCGTDAECWPWLGFKRPSGHGATSYKSMPINASRKAWILTHGPIERGMCVNHRCDNAVCCNPSHMYLGTRAQNMVDRWASTPSDSREFGRSLVLTDVQQEQLWEMRRNNVRLKDCAAKLGVHIATVCRYITKIRARKVAALQATRMSASRAP